MRSNGPSWLSFLFWFGIGGWPCSNFLASNVHLQEGAKYPNMMVLGPKLAYPQWLLKPHTIILGYLDPLGIVLAPQEPAIQEPELQGALQGILFGDLCAGVVFDETARLVL